MSFALRVDDDAPRYFRHRTLGGACETSFECTGVTLLSAREGAKRVTVRARCDSGPSFVIARLIPDVHESVSFVHVFEGEDARFSARGGSVELRGTTEHEIRAVDSSDDEGCDSDESWGSDVEASREVAETAGGNEDARARRRRLDSRRRGRGSGERWMKCEKRWIGGTGTKMILRFTCKARARSEARGQGRCPRSRGRGSYDRERRPRNDRTRAG